MEYGNNQPPMLGQVQQGPSPGPGTTGQDQRGIQLKRLRQCHPSLNLAQVKTLKALYRGGQHLLGNDAILDNVFPKYTHEKPGVYAERKRRAYYENIFALVINQISAGLAQDPIRINVQTEEKVKSSKEGAKNLIAEAEAELAAMEGEDAVELDELSGEEDESLDYEVDDDPIEEVEEVEEVEKEVDEYWKELMDNATALSDDGSNRRSFDKVTRDAGVEALVCGWSWLQADLPAEDLDAPPPSSLKEQEDDGSLRAYVISWGTECVTDWEEENGKFLWVRTYTCDTPGADFTKPRDTKVHTWTIWTDTEWIKYVVEERRDQPMPGEETVILPRQTGSHSFGRVPWVRLSLCQKDGSHLHVGDIIESLCRAYFNRQNGESFQWSQFNYQQLYEFLGPEIAGIDTVVSESQQDPNRAKRTRSPGEVHVRGNEDRAEFVGPNMQGADVGRNALQDLRDAILRVVAQMALAQDTSGAMLRRSADSKRQDSVAQEIVLGAIGKQLVTMANALAELLAAGRGMDEEPPELIGYQHFNVTDAEALINQSVMVEGLDIPSATYQIEQKFALASAHLGDNASSETKEKIKEELKSAITQDQFMMPEPDPMAEEDPFAEDDPDEPDELTEEQMDEELAEDEEAPPSKKGKNPFAKGGK